LIHEQPPYVLRALSPSKRVRNFSPRLRNGWLLLLRVHRRAPYVLRHQRSDWWQPALLRLRRERPRRRAAAPPRRAMNSLASYVNHGTFSATTARARASLTSTRRRRLSLPQA